MQKLTGDDLLTTDEVKSAQTAQTLSGTTSPSEAGQTITVTLNGKTYSGTVNSDGSWQISLPGADLQALANGTYPLVASITDKAGNITTLPAQTITVDSTAEAINIKTLSGDGCLNAVEATQPLMFSGTTANVAAGQTVTINFNGHVYTTTNSNGSWSVQVPAIDVSALPDGKLTVSASVSDTGGNSASNSHTLNVIAQPADLPTIAIATVSGDDVINARDAGSPMTISGSITHVTPGRTVTLTLNNKTYQATVGSEGSWSTTVPANDVQALPQGQQSITANVSDIAHNPASNSHTITVDTTPP